MQRPPPPDALPTCQLMTSPLFHVSGLHTGAIVFMATGIRSGVARSGKFDPLTAARVIEQERCTGWSITETVLHRMVNHPEIAQVRHLVVAPDRRRRFAGVAERCSDAHATSFRTRARRWARLRAHRVHRARDDVLGQELIDHPLSCGRPLPTVQLEIRDPTTGEALPEGDEGEVVHPLVRW